MKDTRFAVDLGTTNTVVARWNDDLGRPEIIRLEDICRNRGAHTAIDDSSTIPSTVYLLRPEECYSFPLKYLYRNRQKYTGGLIGRRADEQDGGLCRDRYITGFKPALAVSGYRFIGKLGKWNFTADDATRIFFKSLFSSIKDSRGISVSGLTCSIPVDFYEFYRARLQKITRQAGIKFFRTIDEPVAAALGYGLSVNEGKNILVIDFGGGTLDLALIRMKEGSGNAGHCTVIAKTGVPLGGNTVDEWILQKVCSHYGYDAAAIAGDPSSFWWYRMLLAESCRVKESLFLKERETFYLLPSAIIQGHNVSLPGKGEHSRKPVDITGEEFHDLLREKGLYGIIDRAIITVLERAGSMGINEKDISDVLLVGGSTLLPGVYKLIEDRFGRDRVRAWQPLNAVAFGAAAFAAGKVYKDDHITHDYAFITYDRKSHDKQYNIIIPAGTGFPTPPDLWKRQLTPTCALGVPERLFKLVICEIGKKHALGQEFIWDEKGSLHSLDEGTGTSLIVPLNESDPTLGVLDPPHQPGDSRARVDLSFMINEDKWLCATVFDLLTGKYLFREKPVIRLK